MSYALTALTPDQFEVLAFLLAREEFPGTVHIRQNDYGLDARLADRQGKTVRGWQAKRFTGPIAWSQCQDSARRAIAFWRPVRMTFVFPKILSGSEQDQFREQLIERFPLIALDWWDATEVEARMRDTPGGQRAADWLFSNPEADAEAMRRALAVGGELSNAAQAAERIAEVQRFIGRDPHLQFVTIASEEGVPQPPPAEPTILSMEATIAGHRIRFDGSERYPGAAADAGLGGTLFFDTDEEGTQALAAFERISREGGTMEASSGITADFGRVPLGLRGLMPEGRVTGSFQITASTEPLASPQIPVLLRAGDTELGLVLGAGDATDGWDFTLAGSAGGLDVTLPMRKRDDTVDMTLRWHWRLGEGDAIEQLLAAQIVLAAYRSSDIDMLATTEDRVVAVASMHLPDDAEHHIADLESICRYLEYAAEAQAWLGTPIQPAARPTDSDLATLNQLIGRIRHPEADGTWDRVEVTLSTPPPFGGGPFAALLRQPIYGDLFGHRQYLGREAVDLPEARIRPFTGSEAPGDRVTIIPAGATNQVRVMFASPTTVPEPPSRHR